MCSRWCSGDAPGAVRLRPRHRHWDVRPGEKWPAAMRTTLMAILAQADGLAMLDGWERSEGAQLEANVARSLMMPVKTVSQWAARMPAKRGRKTCK